MIQQKHKVQVGFVLSLLLCNFLALAQYKEKYRPQFHFSPLKGWIGDPDGLVFTDGKYHLFWWGHAVSEDLVHWKELPYPMKGGDGSFSYFSGSVVVDRENTSGFGPKSMVAIYTRHMPGDSLPETQALSVSNDGIYFHYYQDNPVLDINKVFFRDPQVFWYEPQQKWIMVVVLPDVQKIQVYDSKDLKNWNFLSDFGGLGAQSAFWECPDLFELPVEGDGTEKRWVMLIGRGPNKVQYFVGSFDGETFKADEETAAYLSLGKGLPGEIFADFEERALHDWNASGDGFSQTPANLDSVVHLGTGFVSSYSRDSNTGTLTSSPFTISQNAINFLVAGGNDVKGTAINLVVDGKVVRSTTGDNSSVFKWKGWDVHELKGKKATIQIIDNIAGGKWGYIAIDHILFSDLLMNQGLEHAIWIDYGTDFYAARTWRDIEKVSNRTVMLGWLGNWDYARVVPGSWGKGFESVPREIKLVKQPAGIRLMQRPIPELQKLRAGSYQFKNRNIKSTGPIKGFQPSQNTYELEVTFDTNTKAVFGLNLLVGNGRKLVVQYDPATANLSLDRTLCTDFTANTKFNQKFPAKMNVAVAPQKGKLRLHILVDQSSVEVFTNKGEVVLSALTFPAESQTGIELFSSNGTTNVLEFKAWELSSIWTNIPKD
ncbi:glycoside hydrolase family 32 protein [Rufibacter sp. XAAS-G3-1]|uniref:glycoside hydrolase family 32 protein n=1 Tax=Rufibacter sp. XAAS-G3-1 TaxID=2729134 RepID=UPI0015E7034D|nr:GH32 C-terminal domain-containing protein [Rufibacter sp. XAAS-G3-1]